MLKIAAHCSVSQMNKVPSPVLIDATVTKSTELKSAAHCCVLQMNKVPSLVLIDATVATPTKNSELQQSNKEIASVFEEPKGLPPRRDTFDHKIPDRTDILLNRQI